MNEITLQEMLKQNKERYNKRIEEQRKQIKKEERKEAIIVISASILIIGLLINVLTNIENKAVKSCMNNGNSQEICEMGVK